MWTIAAGILVAFCVITLAGILATAISLLLKLVWIFVAPSEDKRMVRMYRRRDKERAKSAIQ